MLQSDPERSNFSSKGWLGVVFRLVGWLVFLVTHSSQASGDRQLCFLSFLQSVEARQGIRSLQ